jgi:FAD dependent oxidoreductase
MKIDIIGGGVAGCVTALELAAKGHDVCIREYRPELLTGSSHATPCRLTLGFHYFDEETAVRCLRASVKFVRRYPGFKLIDRQKDAQYLRNGWYFITKDSFYKPEEVLLLYTKLAEEYASLVNADPENEVFGLPKDFIRILEPFEYRGIVNTEKVALGIETAECSLDFPLFRTFLIGEIAKYPNIQVFSNQEVLEIRQADNHDGFNIGLRVQDCDKPLVVQTDFVINASWENIEALNQTACFSTDVKRTMRTKGMLEVKLPMPLAEMHSMFFCFGPHCSITNLGETADGYSRAFITSELRTNIEQTTALTISERSKRLLSGGATPEEKVQLSKDIIRDASEYIPGMEGAEYLGVCFGVVKTEGEVDIRSANSSFNQRRETGISEQQFGYISNASMKLLLCLENALAVADLVDRHEKALSNIRTVSIQVASEYFPSGSRTMTHFFTKYLQLAALGSRIDVTKDTNKDFFSARLVKTIRPKEECLKALKVRNKTIC